MRTLTGLSPASPWTFCKGCTSHRTKWKRNVDSLLSGPGTAHSLLGRPAVLSQPGATSQGSEGSTLKADCHHDKLGATGRHFIHCFLLL